MPVVSRRTFYGLTAALVVAVLLAIGFIWSGLYNIAADDPHTKPVFTVLQELRENSIRVRSADVKVPNLDDEQLVLKGAGQYAAMCTGCHLAPGMEHSELRDGLYPLPPILYRERVDPKAAFWIIKHGIKMSGMPAWGRTHDDPTIWSMVAFLRKLPDLSPAQYRAIVAKAPPDDDMDMDMPMAHPGSAASDAHDDHTH